MGSRHRDISRTVVLLASLLAQKKICLLFSLFALLVRPIAKKNHVKEIYLFGSYARGEADAQSDLDFLIFKSAIKTGKRGNLPMFSRKLLLSIIQCYLF